MATEGGFDVRSVHAFSHIVSDRSRLEKLAAGMGFVEGPVWIDEGYLIFSDIPGNELKRWSPEEGLSTFRKPSHNTNGNTLDRQSRLISCEHGSRTVTRTNPDGAVQTLASEYLGRPLNSPNDAVVREDGFIWFTDPPYGINAATQREQPANYVFRLDPSTGTLTSLIDDFDMPNGLCFSPDEQTLYVADSGRPHHIRAFDIVNGDTLANGRVFCTLDAGVPDGIRADTDGRIYSSAGDGVHVFLPSGELIGKILVPETPANLTFGGPGRNMLFITAQTSLYRIQLETVGAQQP